MAAEPEFLGLNVPIEFAPTRRRHVYFGLYTYMKARRHRRSLDEETSTLGRVVNA